MGASRTGGGGGGCEGRRGETQRLCVGNIRLMHQHQSLVYIKT